MNLLRLSEFLSWVAIGTVVLSQNGVLGAMWPFAFGFAWLFARLTGAPVVDDAYVYLGLSLLLCLGAAYAAMSSNESLTTVLLLKAQPGWSSALLGLGYGVTLACVVRLAMMRGNSRELDSGVVELRERIDSTTFGTNTDRKTSPILVLVLLVIAACLLYVLLR